MASFNRKQLDILFVGEHALWPVDQGFSIRGSNMLKAMHAMGMNVASASITPLPEDADALIKNLSLDWPIATQEQQDRFFNGWSGLGKRARLRIADYQGRDLKAFAGIIALIEKHKPKTVMGLGQHSIMMLKALEPYTNIRKVWYAADELVYFQLSCMKSEGIKTIKSRMQKLALYAAMEMFYVRGMDGAIGVAPREAKMLKLIAGAKKTTCIRNGVDMDYFAPPVNRPNNKQLVFWGRMDFEPNIDAVNWFTENVWPNLHAKHPDATFKIVGKNPTPAVESLGQIDGIEVTGGVPDIRPFVHQSSATVMPMRCGGGIKNKLLEAAAMGIPTICSPKAVDGLEGDLPVMQCNSPKQWITNIENLWGNPEQSQTLSRQLRQWVMAEHSWPNAAKQMLEWLDRLPCQSGHYQRHTPLLQMLDSNQFVNKEAA